MDLNRFFRIIVLPIVAVTALCLIALLIANINFSPSAMLTDETTKASNAIPTSTPVSFINPKDLSIPSSYMGYNVTKLPAGSLDLGGGAGGDEWVVKKSGVSDFEYGQVKNFVNSQIQNQLISKGWTEKSKSDSQSEYTAVLDGKQQFLILNASKDKSGAVLLKVFLSNILEIRQ